MSKYRNLLFYVTTIGGFSLLMYYIVLKGAGKQAAKAIALPTAPSTSSFGQFLFVTGTELDLKVLKNQANEVVAMPHPVALYQALTLEPALLEQKDLLLISLDAWKQAVESQQAWLPHAPSVLILKRG